MAALILSLMDPIDEGDALRLRAVFLDTAAAAFDPDDVTLTVDRPDGAELVYTYPVDITTTDVGAYERVLSFAVAGSWKWRWIGTGAANAAINGAVYVRTSVLDPAAPFTGITGAEVAAWSKVRFGELDEPFDTLQLDMLVAESAGFVSEVTGRTIDSTLPAQGTNLVPLVRQSVRMRAEQMAYLAQPDSIELNADEAIQNLSAGGFSVSLRGPVRTGKSASGALPITGWPQLDSVLYLAMTIEQREYWQYVVDGTNVPYSAVSEVDWDGGSLGLRGGLGETEPHGFPWGA